MYRTTQTDLHVVTEIETSLMTVEVGVAILLDRTTEIAIAIATETGTGREWITDAVVGVQEVVTEAGATEKAETSGGRDFRIVRGRCIGDRAPCRIFRRSIDA